MIDHETSRDNTIELRTPEGTIASINPQGAYLESLRSSSGHNMLFPRQTTETGKDRGGIPICAPVFGPGEKVGLKQHGYARNLNWNVVEEGGNFAVLELTQPHLQDETLQTYADCAMKTIMMLEKDRVSLTLSISNNGQDPFVISPGFHPYFPAGPDTAESVKIVSATEGISRYTAEQLMDTQTVPNDRQEQLIVDNGVNVVTVDSQGLGTTVAWTDNPERYICVEPTYAGDVTAKDSTADLENYMLQPGETMSCNMKLVWK